MKALRLIGLIALLVLLVGTQAFARSATNRSVMGSTRQPGGVLIIDDIAEHPHNIWFVDANAAHGSDAASSGRNPDRAFLTLDYAISHANVEAGDVIYVLPGHAEDIATSTSIDVDVAGISIIGLGSGSKRPRFDYDAADSAFDIGANDCLIRNLTFRPGITSTLIGVEIETGVTGTVIEDCEFLVGEAAGTDEFVLTLKLTSGNHDTIIRRNTFRTAAADASCTDCIDIAAAASRVRIEDNVFVGNYSTAAISDGAACTNLYIVRNHIKVKDGEPGIELTATTTGIIANNCIESTGIDPTAAIVAADCSWFNNYCVDADGTVGTAIADASEGTMGSDWYVNSRTGSDANNSGKSWAQALATIDAAVNKCTADRGDVIHVAACHAETVSAESGIDVDAAGVRVLGYVHGRLMPTITFDTDVAADLKLAANGCSLENIRLLGGIDATTGVLEITGNDCAVINCEYRDVTGEATDIIVTDNALRLLIDGFRCIGASGDGGDSAIMLDECDHAVIRNCHIIGNFDVGAIECRTTASDDICIHDCHIKTFGSEDLAVKDTITASTGFIGPRIFCQVADNADNITEVITGATFVIVDPIYVVNLAGEKGMLIDWTATAAE